MFQKTVLQVSTAVQKCASVGCVIYQVWRHLYAHTWNWFQKFKVGSFHLLSLWLSFITLVDSFSLFSFVHRELNIKCCHITDDGIEGLCGGPSNGGTEMPIDQRGQCKSLRILSIARHETAQVTRKGVKMAIRHLPHLKILIFEPSARNSTLAQYTAKRLDAAKVHLGKIGILSRRC